MGLKTGLIDDLNVAGMLKNHTLARRIADMGLREFRRPWAYQATPRGKTVIVVNRWYPRSKICSAWGYIMPTMLLAVREWLCPACGAHHDRDIHAAINLRKGVESSVRDSSPVPA